MRFIVLILFFTSSFYTLAKQVDKENQPPALALKSLGAGELLSREKIVSLFDYYSENSIDSLYVFGNNLIEAGLRYENWFYINYGKSVLASYFNSISKVIIAIQLSKECLDYALNIQDYEMTCFLQNQIGISYVLNEKYEDARKWFEKSITSGRQTGKFEENCVGYKNIAESYYREGNYEQAIVFANLYIQNIEKIKSKTALAKVYNTLGNVYRDKEDMKQAERYYTKSFKTAQGITSALVKANALNNLAIVYFEEDLEKSKHYFLKALKVRQQHKNPAFIADSYLNLGHWNYMVGNMDSALYYYEYMYDYCVKNKHTDGQIEALEVFEEITEDQAKLSAYQKERIALQEKINSDRQQALEEYIGRTQVKIEKEIQQKNNLSAASQSSILELPFLKMTVLLILGVLSGLIILFSLKKSKK